MAVDDANLRQQLLRHLIRSDVSTFVNRLFVFLAQNYDVDWPTTTAPTNTCQKAPRGSKPKGGRRGKKSNSFHDDSDDVGTEKQVELPEKKMLAAELIGDFLSEITGPQRDALVNLLKNISSSTSSEPTTEAANCVLALNSCLRVNQSDVYPDGGLPLDEIFSLCDDLASSHLGINLSVSVHRAPRSDSKRKRQDRALALDLAAQTECQVVQAMDEASVALASSALFGHALVGWPLLVHGKLVPQISVWIKARLDSSSSSETVYPTAVKDLRESKAGDDLVALKDVVMLKARGNEDTSDDEVKALINRLSAAASRCMKLMQSGTT